MITETPPTETPPTETPPVEEPPAEEPAAEIVPLTVDDIKIPEGYEVIEPLRDKFLETMNDASLSPQERASALLALHKETIDAAQETDSKAWSDMQETWKEEAKTVLGDKLQPTITNIAKLIDEYGSDDLRDAFNFTGAGNNVHVIQFLGKIAEQLTEGTHDAGRPSTALSSEEERAQRLYPSMKKG